MKAFLALPLLVGCLFAFVKPVDDTAVVFYSGDPQGLLTPCGCSDPMSGGIRRLGTALKRLSTGGTSLFLENGGLVAGSTRQDQLKLETITEALVAMNVTAIHVSYGELAVGQDALPAMENLAPGRLIGSTAVQVRSGGKVAGLIEDGPFLVGAGSEDIDVEQLVREASSRSLNPIFMLDGDRKRAEALARNFAALRLIVYRAGGRPDKSWQGNTLLVTPGEKGKQLGRLVYRNGRFVAASLIDLGPQYPDDPTVEKLFKDYLRRVSEEKLLAGFPRKETGDYVGNLACAKCHAQAAATWNASRHPKSLVTLKQIGESDDPDCVKCHVTGLDSTHGYRSERLTPTLASVTCESCHGPGGAHAASPRSQSLSNVGPTACVKCHTSEQSPHFDFASYWAKIKH